MLTDRFGRTITDLRISVTRRCNFRCVYCHNEGLGTVLPARSRQSDEMTPETIERFVRIGREFGIRSVKFTGGEPLVREDLEEIVARSVRHVPDVSLATNGSMLAKRAASLRAAGLKRVNVSADTLDPEAFREIRRGHLAPVMDGIAAALEAGLKPVKVNMVLMQSTLPHLDRLIDHAARTDGLRLQLIQFMPELAGDPAWGVDIDSVKANLAARADRILVREMHRRRIYLLGGAEVEVVDPVGNREFCMNCRRLRITHDGRLKGCLNRDDDLLPAAHLDDDGLRDAYRTVAGRRVPYYGVFVTDRFDTILERERSRP